MFVPILVRMLSPPSEDMNATCWT